MESLSPSRGRPKTPGGHEAFKLYLPTSLAVTLRLLLTDPVTGKIPNGALSSMFEEMAREYIRREKARIQGI